MAYDIKNSKYFRNKDEKKDEEKKEENKSEKKEYRKSVITPKRAKELAMQEESGIFDSEEPSEEVKEEKSEPEKTEKHEYRKSVITPKRAKELALEAEQKALEPEPEPEPEPEEEPEEDTIRSKGTATDIFKGDGNETEKEKFYEIESAKKSTKNVRKNAVVRMLVCMIILTVAAIVLNEIPAFKIHVPYTPQLLTVDFSALPSLIATIAYGPLFGVAICVIKNLVLILVNTDNFISAVNNILLDSVFLLITGYLYSYLMFRRDRNAYRKHKGLVKPYDGKRVILSSVIGALISLVPQLFITRYIAYPLIDKFLGPKYGYTFAWLRSSYAASVEAVSAKLPEAISAKLPDLSGLLRGIAFFNLPITFAKLLIISVAGALILKLILPFLQYGDKKARSNITVEKD